MKKLQQIGEDALQNSVVRIMWEKSGKKKGDNNALSRGSGFFVKKNLIAYQHSLCCWHKFCLCRTCEQGYKI